MVWEGMARVWLGAEGPETDSDAFLGGKRTWTTTHGEVTRRGGESMAYVRMSSD